MRLESKPRALVSVMVVAQESHRPPMPRLMSSREGVVRREDASELINTWSLVAESEVHRLQGLGVESLSAVSP